MQLREAACLYPVNTYVPHTAWKQLTAVAVPREHIPHRPWQRGSNENANGLIREFLPKGMDLSNVSHQQLTSIEHALNNRPRKILGFESLSRGLLTTLVPLHRRCRTSSLSRPSVTDSGYCE